MRSLGLAVAVFMVGVLCLPVLVATAAVGALGAALSAPAGQGDPPPQPAGGSTGAVHGIPGAALADYRAAAATCPGLSWAVLAGIGEVESNHGQSTAPGVHGGANAYGAEGPMQFLPATFRAYAVARADGTPPSPYDMGDATRAAARMLCANGAGSPAGLRNALWAYNHSWQYVDLVLTWADRYLKSL